MPPKPDPRLNRLCQKVQDEKNPQKFDEYVRELADLLDKREQMIRQAWKADPSVTKPKAKASEAEMKSHAL
jgi:hypothetical protein